MLETKSIFHPPAFRPIAAILTFLTSTSGHSCIRHYLNQRLTVQIGSPLCTVYTVWWLQNVALFVLHFYNFKESHTQVGSLLKPPGVSHWSAVTTSSSYYENKCFYFENFLIVLRTFLCWVLFKTSRQDGWHTNLINKKYMSVIISFHMFHEFNSSIKNHFFLWSVLNGLCIFYLS